MRLIHVVILLISDNVAYACQKVSQNCFDGQFGYPDTAYLPIRFHLAVIQGNQSGEIETFCTQYDELKSCVKKDIFSCPAEDEIWGTWNAIEILNNDLCSFSNLTNVAEYYQCLTKYDLWQEVTQCNEQLSWDLTAYNEIEFTTDKYKEFLVDYEGCMLKLVTENCSDTVKSWLPKYFEASYFSQMCSASVPADCSATSPEVEAAKTRCENEYDMKLLSVDILNHPQVDICNAVEAYAKCVLDAVAKECGKEQAETEMSYVKERRDLYIALFNCNVDDVVIDESRSFEDISCLQTDSCLSDLDVRCPTLPYTDYRLPNRYDHQTPDETGRALDEAFPSWSRDQCSPLLTCFLCSVYFPVCSDFKDLVLPCRSLCETVKQSCADAWNDEMQCDDFPDTGFCLDASQCGQTNFSHEPIPGKTTLITTSTTSESPTELRKNLTISFGIIAVLLAIIVVAGTVVMIKRCHGRNKDNVVYNLELERDTESRTDSQSVPSGVYNEIDESQLNET